VVGVVTDHLTKGNRLVTADFVTDYCRDRSGQAKPTEGSTMTLIDCLKTIV